MNQRLFKQAEYTVLKPHTDRGDVMKKVAALLIVALAVSSSLAYAQSQTEKEVV